MATRTPLVLNAGKIEQLQANDALKLPAGTDLAITEAGAVEYDGTNLHFTNAGLQRRNLATEQYVQSRGLNLVTNGSGLLNDNTNFSGFTFDATETHGGGGSFLHTSIAYSIKSSDEYIPVDISKPYLLSGWAKSGNADGTHYNAANAQYLGLYSYDADFLIIGPECNAKYAGSTDTTLAVALNPGDTTVTLTDATGWYNGTSYSSRHFAWWPYTNAKGYTYPNYTYTRNNTQILFPSARYTGSAWTAQASSIASPVWASADKSLSRASGSFLYEGVVAGDTITSTDPANPGVLTVATVAALKLTFVEPVADSTAATVVTYVGEGITGNVIKLRVPWAGAALPIGTPISNHSDGPGAKYTAANYATVPNAWTEYVGVMEPYAGNRLYAINEFGAGTQYVRILFLLNYVTGDNYIRWSDLRIEERLKLPSESLAATPTVGVLEFLTDKLYFTITTGPARKEIALTEGLTSGRVPFATTNGRLIDDVDFTFSVDTLTVTKIATTEIKDSGLTAGRVVFAGVGGLLTTDGDLTFSGDTLTATKIATTSVTSSDDLPLVAAAGKNVKISGVKYPNADGTANQVLKTDGTLVVGWAFAESLITNAARLIKEPSSNIRHIHDALAQTTSTSYVKLKTITLTNGLLGSQNFGFTVMSGRTCYLEIRRNGGAALASCTYTSLLTSTPYVYTITQDWAAGDTCELWGYTSDAAGALQVTNFRIYYDNLVTVASANS